MVETPTILVPVEVLDGETVDEGVIELLAPTRVALLGYYVVPDQTPPGQARMQFEDQLRNALDDIADALSDAGATVSKHIAFTADEEKTFERIRAEENCTATLWNDPAKRVDRVLVPLRGDVDVETIVEFVAALAIDRDLELTLYATGEGTDADAAAARLDAAIDRLVDRGIPRSQMTTRVEATDRPIRAITAAAQDHDAVVMDERAPSLRTFLFGEDSEQVAERFLGPVIVVHPVDDGTRNGL